MNRRLSTMHHTVQNAPACLISELLLFLNRSFASNSGLNVSVANHTQKQFEIQAQTNMEKLENRKKSDVIFVDLNCDLRFGHPNLSSRTYEITVDNVDRHVATPEWEKRYGNDFNNLCFYTKIPKHDLKITPNAPCDFYNEPRFFNIFVNEKHVALLRVTNVDNFCVSLYPKE